MEREPIEVNLTAASTNYTNTTLTANNGDLTINSNNNTNIKGADLLAQNTTINTVNDLNIQSLQNHTTSKSKSSSINIGAGGSAGGGLSSISLGYNQSSSKFNRDWVDDQTSIIGINSITINTGSNTKLKGALIANSTNGQIGREGIDGGNLALNTGTLTIENIYDSEKQKTNGFGLSTNIGTGTNSSNTTNKNPNQDKTYFPTGSTTLSLQSEGYTKEQITKATIGKGTININGITIADNDNQLTNLNRDINKSQEITKDTITGALDVSAAIDNRVIGAALGNQAAQNSLISDQKNLWENLEDTTKQQFEIGKKVWASPNTALAATWGIVGLTAGALIGRDVEITLDHNAIQFEGNPLVQRAFTLGNVSNYPTTGSNPDGPNDTLKYSYTGRFYNSATIGDHEEPHTYQGENLGPFFLPAYVVRGVIGNYQAGQSILSMPNSENNPYEIEADNHARTKE